MRSRCKPERGFLLSLMLPALAGCDSFYGVYRTTPLPEGFSPAAAETVLQAEPGYCPTASAAWDGTTMQHAFERHGGHAAVHVIDGELLVESVRIGPPDDAELHAWLRLQGELIATLHEHFPALPPASHWAWFETYLGDRLRAAGLAGAER